MKPLKVYVHVFVAMSLLIASHSILTLVGDSEPTVHTVEQSRRSAAQIKDDEQRVYTWFLNYRSRFTGLAFPPPLLLETVREENRTSCSDPSLLMPLCERCIPGLVTHAKNGTHAICVLSSATETVRLHLTEIAQSRGQTGCGAYKYLSTTTLRERHRFAGKVLDKLKPARVIDIGVYTNPIHTFMTYCPATFFMVEPCGELAHDGNSVYLSTRVTCAEGGSKTLHVLPTSIKTFIHNPYFQHFDAVVCMGCDVNYGPTWDELMSFPRPCTIILEFSTLAFGGDYPTTDTRGCRVTHAEDFNFTDCPDCDYDKDRYSEFGKLRKLLVYECGDYPQAERAGNGAALLKRSDCSSSLHRHMACIYENNSIRMGYDEYTVVDALSVKEITDTKMLVKAMNIGKKSRQDWPRLSYTIARTWWNIEQQPWRLSRATMFLAKGRELEKCGDIWGAIYFVGAARTYYQAALPQEIVRGMLYETIQFHTALIRRAIAQEHVDQLGYRFFIKACPLHLDRSYVNEVAEMEPILQTGRNMDFREFDSLISFYPYRPLISFESVLSRTYRKRILVDVGANGFAASTKQLMDMYGAFVPFDEVIIFEPDDDGMDIPSYYKNNKTQIRFHRQYIQPITRNVSTDLVSWIRENVRGDDFFVLKFDVDEGVSGVTMEWGFLADLVHSEELKLVDELFIELHYSSAELGWQHHTHSGRQRYDVVRQLRACGMPIHDWP